MKKLMVVGLAVSFLFIAGSCSKDQQLPEMLEVELSVKPEAAQVNQPIIFEAKVTQGKDTVEDAKEVKFEIWRSQDDQHEKVEVQHTKNGIYRLERSFQQEGTYYIISHVTARDMHNMPKKEFVVGTPSETEDATNSMDQMDMDEHDNGEEQSTDDSH